MQPRVDEVAFDGFFPQRAQRLQPVIPFDQHEPAFAFPKPDRCRLTILKHVIRQRLDLLGIERLGAFYGHVDVCDRDGFFLEHGVERSMYALL